MLYSCDNSRPCQVVASRCEPSRRPGHVLENIEDALAESVAARLDRIEAAMPALEDRSAVGADAMQMLQAREEGYQQMATFLIRAGEEALKLGLASRCLLRNKECELRLATDCGMSIDVSGITCVAFSPAGDRAGRAHPSMRTLHVYCARMRALRPTIKIIECSHLFDKNILRWWFEDVDRIDLFDHPGPAFHGFPVNRPRMYALCVSRAQATFLGSAAEYFRLFRVPCETTGDIFFTASEDLLQRELAVLCRRRKLQPSLATRWLVDWSQLYGPGQQKRLAAYLRHREACRQATEARRDDDEEGFICDLEHNVGCGSSCGPRVPALMRHGMLHSVSKGRLAVPLERFLMQGNPVQGLVEPGFSLAYQNLLDSGELSRRDIVSLTGNAMFTPTVSSIILYALASTELVPAPRLQMLPVEEEDE